MPGLQDISSLQKRGVGLETDWITMQSEAKKSLRELEYDRARTLWENNEMGDDLFYEKVKRMLAEAPTNTEKEKWFVRQKDAEGAIFKKNVNLKEDRLALDLQRTDNYKGYIEGMEQLAQMAAAQGDENLSLSYLLKAENAKEAWTNKQKAGAKKASAEAEAASLAKFGAVLGEKIKGLAEIGEVKKTGSSVKDYVDKLDNAFKNIFDAIAAAKIPDDVKSDLYSLVTGQKNWEFGERGGLNADDLVNFFKDSLGESIDKTNAGFFASQQELINKVRNNPKLDWWFIQADDGSWRIGLAEEAPADKYVQGKKYGSDGKAYQNYAYLARGTGEKDAAGNEKFVVRDFDDLSQPARELNKGFDGKFDRALTADADAFDFSPTREAHPADFENRRFEVKKAFGELLRRDTGTLEARDPEGFNHYLREWRPNGKDLATIAEIRQDMKRSKEYKDLLLQDKSRFEERSMPGYAAGEFIKSLLGGIGSTLGNVKPRVAGFGGIGSGHDVNLLQDERVRRSLGAGGKVGAKAVIPPVARSVSQGLGGDYMDIARDAALKGPKFFKGFFKGLTNR